MTVGPSEMGYEGRSVPRLPFSFPRAVKASEFGMYGLVADALIGGLAAAAGASIPMVIAITLAIALGSPALGYRLGRTSPVAAE